MARLAAERGARGTRARTRTPGSGPMTRAPSVSTFMSSCSTPWCAEYVSWQTAARMPRILLAATDAPTPEPQIRIPRSASPATDRLAEALGEVRVVVVRVGAVAAEVDQLVAEVGRREPAEQLVLERGPGVVGGERDAHAGKDTAADRSGRTGGQLWPGSESLVRPTPASPLPSVGCCPKWPPSSVGMRPCRPSRTTRRRDVGDAIGGEPELLEDRAGRRRRAEVVEPDDRALVADPALPAERDADLDADPLADGRRQDRVAVRLVLGLEPLPARQRDDARRDAVRLERLGRRERQLELRARPDQDQLRACPPRRLAQDVAAAARRPRGRARPCRRASAASGG